MQPFNMKKILFFIFPILLFSFYSCGILQSESDPMPIHQEGYANRIYSVNIDGSNLKFLSIGDAYITSRTADTIFIQSNDSIYSANYDGSNKHLLTPGSYQNFWLSSGKNKVCLHQYPSYNNYFINTDGSGLTKLNLVYPAVDTWDISPSGDKVVFSCSNGLFIANIDGSNTIMLNNPVSSLHFSPDGNYIVYNQQVYLSTTTSLFIYNLQSGLTTKIFPDYVDYDLSLNKILFTSSGGVYLYDIGNKTNSLLTSGGSAHFSANGSRFVSFNANQSMNIYDLNSFSTVSVTSINMPQVFCYNPNITPGNNGLIFQSDSTYYLSKK